MGKNFQVPWHRYGLIAELTHRLKDKSPQFGKTALQKMIFLLQEGLGIDCDYEFEFYTYGPFTSQIFQDMGVVEASEAITVSPASPRETGYVILPGKNYKSLTDRAKDFLDRNEVKDGINRLIQDFGNYRARGLELRATIIYIERAFKKAEKKVETSTISKMVSELKPKFPVSEIEAAIEGLNTKQYIALSGSP
jgi:uncharacterized protein